MTLMLFAGLAMVGLGPNHIRESGHWVFEFLMDPFCGPGKRYLLLILERM